MLTECYHCKQKITDKKTHNCWTTTEEKLTEDLPEDLLEAWLRIRESLADLGEQRIYASFKSIMFSRKACHVFVRPRPNRLEVCFFVGRQIKHPMIRKVYPSTRTKTAHLIHIVHRDEVESPVTDWFREAYGFQDTAQPRARKPAKKPSRKKLSKPKSKKKTKKRRKKT